MQAVIIFHRRQFEMYPFECNFIGMCVIMKISFIFDVILL